MDYDIQDMLTQDGEEVVTYTQIVSFKDKAIWLIDPNGEVAAYDDYSEGIFPILILNWNTE